MVVSYSAPLTPFTLPPELDDVKKLVRSIVDEQCLPLEHEFLRLGTTGTHPSDWYSPTTDPAETLIEGALPPAHWERLRQLSEETGLYRMHLPHEFGGGDLGFLGQFVVAEEIHRSVVRLPVAYVPHILFECTAGQRAEFLEPVLREESRTAFAQTEPGAGSDPGNSMQTRAVRLGDDWVINGSKMFITGADQADILLLLAVTDETRRQHGGITMFLVPTKSPGISMRPIETWLTVRPHQFHVELDDVRVPHTSVLGAEGLGFELGQRWLALQDRLTRGSLACGILSRSLDLATAWAKERTSFGKALAEHQAIQWMLADVFIDLKCIRAVSYECAARADAGEDVRVLAALAKFTGANWGHRSIDKVMQIFGGLGETSEMPIPHWYRELRHGRIGGGTDEMQRIIMARALLKAGKSVYQA